MTIFTVRTAEIVRVLDAMMQMVVFEGAVAQHVALIIVLLLKRDLVAVEQEIIIGDVRTHADDLRMRFAVI